MLKLLRKTAFVLLLVLAFASTLRGVDNFEVVELRAPKQVFVGQKVRCTLILKVLDPDIPQYSRPFGSYNWNNGQVTGNVSGSDITPWTLPTMQVNDEISVTYFFDVEASMLSGNIGTVYLGVFRYNPTTQYAKIIKTAASKGDFTISNGKVAFSVDVRNVPTPCLYMYGESKANTQLSSFNTVNCADTDAAYINTMREQGKMVCIPVSNPSGQTAQQLYDLWKAPFDNDMGGTLPGGADAIGIDELHSTSTNGTAEAIAIHDALVLLKTNYPGKRVFVAAVYKYAYTGNNVYSDVLNAVKDHADMFMQEIYFSESQYRGSGASNYASRLQTVVPGILSKTIFLLAISQFGCCYETSTDIGFWAFLDAQLHEIRNDVLASAMQGVGYWIRYRSEPLTIEYVNMLTNHYYIQASTDYFGDGDFPQLIPNAQFDEGGNNLVLNNSFESGPVNYPTSWSFWTGGGNPIMGTNTDGHTGRCVYIQGDGNDYGMLYQNIAVQANTDYMVTFWYKYASSAGAGCAVEFGNQSSVTVGPMSTTWTKQTFIAKTLNATQRLSFILYNRNNTLYIDDIQIRALGGTSDWTLTPGVDGSISSFKYSTEVPAWASPAGIYAHDSPDWNLANHLSYGLKTVRGSTANAASVQVTGLDTNYYYTVSAFVRATNTNPGYRCSVKITKTDGTLIAEQVVAGVGYDLLNTHYNKWTRILFNFIPTDSTVKVILSDADTVSGATLYWDFVELEKAWAH